MRSALTTEAANDSQELLAPWHIVSSNQPRWSSAQKIEMRSPSRQTWEDRVDRIRPMASCPSCSAENLDTSKFCSECGAALRPEYAQTVTLENRADAADDSSSLSETSHHGRFLPGAKVADRYRIVSLIGKGGMGEVYRADDLKLGHTVALKFLPNDLAEDSSRLEYFHSEVRLTRQISHPNVCRVYDIGEVDDQHFLSMEYVDGEDLSVLLRRIGRLPNDKGVQIAQQLCAGLAAAHEKGVLHRDLKPANIMLDGRGQVRITDFGLARLAGEEAKAEIVGTPAYMAPEQLARGETTIQSDLYSLGLILYELFTGEPVHKSNSIPELLKQHQESSPSQPSALVGDMDTSVERAILRCLEQEPHERPKSAHAVAAALPGGDPLAAALAAGETPSPEMVAAAGDAGGLSQRTAALLLLGAGVLLLLNAWLADQTYVLQRSGRQQPLDLKPPSGLAARVQLILGKLGYEDRLAHNVHGFMTDGRRASFWYRQRQQQPFVMDSYWPEFGDPHQSRARPTFHRPPMEFPNEVALELSPDGYLQYLRANPAVDPTSRQSARDASELPWHDWFDSTLIGFQFLHHDAERPTTPGEFPFAVWVPDTKALFTTPPVEFDSVGLWAVENQDGTLTYIEAAALDEKLVYFNVLTRDPSDTDSDAASGAPQAGFMGKFWKLQELLALVAAALLAWRNLRSGRADRRGAMRLTLLLFWIGVIIWITQAQHLLFEGFENEVVTLGLAQVLFDAARIWLMYIAFEPLVRRFWPEVLVSAMRLLRGRSRDSLVGRDLLAGVMAGLVVVILHRINMLANLNLPDSRFDHRTYFNTFSLLGVKELVGSVLDSVGWSITVAGSIIMILVLLRLLVRSGAVATAIGIVFFTYFIRNATGSERGTIWLIGLWMTINYLVAVRLGFLAFATTLAMYYLTCRLPATLDPDVWYFGHSLFVSSCIAAIAIYGFYIAQGKGPASFTAKLPAN